MRGGDSNNDACKSAVRRGGTGVTTARWDTKKNEPNAPARRRSTMVAAIAGVPMQIGGRYLFARQCAG